MLDIYGAYTVKLRAV